jgi:hypothetical protein
MENPYKAPNAIEPGQRRGAPLLGCLFFVVAAFCVLAAIGNLVAASLTFFQDDVRLITPPWQVAAESGFVLFVGILGIVTGIAFRSGRYSFAAVLGSITLLMFVCAFYVF